VRLDQFHQLLAEILTLQQADEGLGAFSRPCATVRGISLARATQSGRGSFSACGHRFRRSLTMKPVPP